MQETLEIILLVLFSYPVVYNLIFTIAAVLYRSPSLKASLPNSKILILIPAYKDDMVIMQTVRYALSCDYPKELFDVAVIADSLSEDTMNLLRSEDIILHDILFEDRNKAKALNFALSKAVDRYQIGVVLDSDNLISKDFLQKVDSAFKSGFVAIQGQRMAKNLDTPYAILDGISEAINNFVFRKGTHCIGLSVPPIGSGYAIEFNLLKSVFSQIDSNGEDRDLELGLMSRGITMRYISEATVLDEKTATSENFQKQRTRWIALQIVELPKNIVTGLKNLFSGRISLFNALVLRQLLPPRLISLGFTILVTLSYIVFQNHLLIDFRWWILLSSLLILQTLASIPKRFYSLQTLQAVISIPKLFFIMILIFFKLRSANTEFIKTDHHYNSNSSSS